MVAAALIQIRICESFVTLTSFETETVMTLNLDVRILRHPQR
jgi:hypothetical protein